MLQRVASGGRGPQEGHSANHAANMLSRLSPWSRGRDAGQPRAGGGILERVHLNTPSTSARIRQTILLITRLHVMSQKAVFLIRQLGGSGFKHCLASTPSDLDYVAFESLQSSNYGLATSFRSIAKSLCGTLSGARQVYQLLSVEDHIIKETEPNCTAEAQQQPGRSPGTRCMRGADLH